jgi:hypothetical protein
MTRHARLWTVAPTLALLVGCSGSDSLPLPSTGGTSANGGATANGGTTGGATASGGTSVSGGNASGGTVVSSGGSVTAGAAGSGNANASGGSAGSNAGGNDAKGGNATGGSSTGGNAGSGGSSSGGVTTGGKTASGGSANGGTSAGGTAGSSTGGNSNTTGGTPVTGAAIINDRFWKDTSGTPIYSQGGGMLQVGDTFYWYGVKYGGAVTYAANPNGKNDDISFQGVTTYSSKDLVNWKLEATDKVANAGGWFGRLGVVYHAGTQKYVLASQGGGGLYFATSSKPNGGFVYNNVQTNLPGIVNGATGDQTLFQDDDGQAYMISSSSSGRANRYVSPLRASDFLAAENAILVYKGGGREGNCLFKYSGTYYFCSSDLHGWNTSQTYCVSATNIRGPWSAEFVMQGTEPDYSHVTQTGFFFNVKGSQQTTVVFAGDRWADFAGNGIGYNQWMPLSFSGTKPIFNSLSAWTINVGTGAWSVAPENNYVLNPSFEADRIDVTKPVGWTTTGTNPRDPHTGNRSFRLTGNSNLTQAIASLPNANYTLSVWAKSSGAGATLVIKGHGGADRSVAIPAGTSWTNVKLSDIAVTSGKAEVSVSSGGQTVNVDDFILTHS